MGGPHATFKNDSGLYTASSAVCRTFCGASGVVGLVAATRSADSGAVAVGREQRHAEVVTAGGLEVLEGDGGGGEGLALHLAHHGGIGLEEEGGGGGSRAAQNRGRSWQGRE